MTIREIIRTASVLLDRTDVVNYLDESISDPSNETLQAIDTLKELANLVIKELAESYIPAVKVEDVTLSDNRLYYSALSATPLKILKVRNKSGEEIGFGYTPEYIIVDRSVVTVEYEYLPEYYALDDQTCYSEKDVSTRIIAYGLVAEYSIVMGEFNHAVSWHKRYTDGVAGICLPQNKNLRMRSFL